MTVGRNYYKDQMEDFKKIKDRTENLNHNLIQPTENLKSYTILTLSHFFIQ